MYLTGGDAECCSNLEKQRKQNNGRFNNGIEQHMSASWKHTAIKGCVIVLREYIFFLEGKNNKKK